MRDFLITLKYKWLIFYNKHYPELVGTLQGIGWGIVFPVFCDAPFWLGVLIAVLLTAFSWICAPIFRKQEHKRQLKDYINSLNEQEENEGNH